MLRSHPRRWAVRKHMDYFQESLIFNIRKVARYIGMYGPRRTFVKIKGQYHMKRRFHVLPEASRSLKPQQKVAIVGCGNFAFSNISYFLHKQFGRVIGACMDVGIDRAASLAVSYHIPFFTSRFDELLEFDQLRLFYIASNHASHTEYAVSALDRGKNVYIEKPHVVSEDQLIRLVDAMRRNPQQRVWLGFNRPTSRFGLLLHEALAAEAGPAIYNWFVAGHEIDPNHWYFKPEEGGRVLGNLCHWTDAVLRLVGEEHYPITVRPASATRSDTDIVVTYTFADGTIAVISFSAKGHTFEGVKEHFSGHKGSSLVSMDNYRSLTIEVIEKKKRYVNWFRDHGHEKNITRAYTDLMLDTPYDSERQIEYVWNTGMLFLKTREALETDREVTIDSYRQTISEAIEVSSKQFVDSISRSPSSAV